MTNKTNEPDIFGGDDTLEDDQSAMSSTARPVWPAIKLGMRGKCPQCEKGRLFKKYTSINDTCQTCQLNISGHRADDAPPYFTMLIAGHIFIPIALEVHRRFTPNIGLEFLIWSIIIVSFALWLLPVVKGALINLQWAHRMHGFSDNPDEDIEESLIP